MKPMFTVKDRAIDTYNIPFTQTTREEAVRNFKDQINDDPKTNPLAKHPDDYDLYMVGEFDENWGKLEPIGNPQLIARGKDLVEPKE